MALFVTTALMLSYIESLFPVLFRCARDEAGACQSGGGGRFV